MVYTFLWNHADFSSLHEKIILHHEEFAFYHSFMFRDVESSCKIYIRSEFHESIKNNFDFFRKRKCTIEFIADEVNEGYVLK